MAPKNADGVAADAHARAGNQSGVDGIAHGGVRRSRALGSHVAFCGEARHQIFAGRDFGEDRTLGYGFNDGLEVLSSRMKEKMDVDVDEPGHQSCRAQIDHRGAAAMGNRDPASTMRLPRTSTSPGLTRVPCSTSRMWAAWSTMASLAGVAVGAAGD